MTTDLFKESLIYSWIRIWFLFLAASCGACATPVWDAPERVKNEPGNTIYLVSHGWHAGVVLRRSEIPDGIWPALEDFSDAEYLEVGWGDMNYYQTPAPHMWLILKAAILPTTSVLHIVGFSSPVPAYFPYSEIIGIELPTADFEHFSRTIAASFARNETGNTTSLGRGLYGNSRFYLSRENYHLFNTCNVWVARALRDAGLPITPARTFTVESLMSQARKFGTLVQSRPEPPE